MTLVVLVILGVGWSLWLASFLRNQARLRSANSISSFTKHLEVLDRARPAPRLAAATGLPVIRSAPAVPIDPLVRPPKVRGLLAGPPITVDDARRRRGEILRILLAVTSLAVVAAVLVGGVALYLAGAAAVVLVGYVALLIRAQKLADERIEKVHYLAFDDEEYDDEAAWYDEWDDESHWDTAWDDHDELEVAPLYRLAR